MYLITCRGLRELLFRKYQRTIKQFCCYCDKPIKIGKKNSKSHAANLAKFFESMPHIAVYKDDIPVKQFGLQRLTPPENMYLIDKTVAERVVSLILPQIQNVENHIIAETNAGLGFITQELLNKGVEKVRVYESCPEFRLYLRNLAECNPNRIDIFHKDFFVIHRFAYMDSKDHGERVPRLLAGVPTKNWTDDPVMTVIGPVSNSFLIRSLMKELCLQSNLVERGRLQFYMFMRPSDYVIFTAGPQHNLHTYKTWSILFDIFFDIELLEKFPRNLFLPWQSHKITRMTRYPNLIDPDQMYLVRLNFKKTLPVPIEELFSLYTFVFQFYKRGNTPIVPTLEKWVPNAGLHLIATQDIDALIEMSIYTTFRELTPTQIVSIYKTLTAFPEFKASPFLDMVESRLIKSETNETDMEEQHAKEIAKAMEINK